MNVKTSLSRDIVCHELIINIEATASANWISFDQAGLDIKAETQFLSPRLRIQAESHVQLPSSEISSFSFFYFLLRIITSYRYA